MNRRIEKWAATAAHRLGPRSAHATSSAAVRKASSPQLSSALGWTYSPLVGFIRTLLAAALVAVSSAAIAGNWEIRTSTDSMTDQVTREAFITSPMGDKFTVIRRRDGSVWGYIQLAGANQFSVSDRLMLRVDKNKPFEFNEDFEKLSKKLGMPIKAWEWNPTLIGFRIWHGKVDDGCGLVKQLFEGTTMVVRYQPNQSTVRDLTFPLGGNQNAISDALGVDVSTCPAK